MIAVDAVPGFWRLLAASCAALLAEIALLLATRARLASQGRAERLASAGDWTALAQLKQPSRLLEFAAAAIPFGVAVPFVRAIGGARSLVEHAVATTFDPIEKTKAVTSAMASEANATLMGLVALAVVVGAACVPVGLAIAVRQRARGLRHAASLAHEWPQSADAWLKFPGPHPAALVGTIGAFLLLAVGPVARGGYEATVMKIRGLADATASDSLTELRQILNRTLVRTSVTLDLWLVGACVGVVAAAVVAGLLSRKLSAARARDRLLGDLARVAPRNGPKGIVIASGAVTAAIAALILTTPIRQENDRDWPMFLPGERPLSAFRTPDLNAPDPFDPVPIIYVTPTALGLDNTELDPEALARQLAVLAGAIGSQERDGTSDEHRLVLICQADTPIDRVAMALRAAVDGASPRVTLGFLSERHEDRPLFGRVSRYLPSGARTTVVTSESDAAHDTTIVDVGTSRTCDALARKVVAERWPGHDVALLLPAAR